MIQIDPIGCTLVLSLQPATFHIYIWYAAISFLKIFGRTEWQANRWKWYWWFSRLEFWEKCALRCWRWSVEREDLLIWPMFYWPMWPGETMADDNQGYRCWCRYWVIAPVPKCCMLWMLYRWRTSAWHIMQRTEHWVQFHDISGTIAATLQRSNWSCSPQLTRQDGTNRTGFDRNITYSTL